MRGLALLVVCWCGAIQAQVPQKLNYQGFLTNPGGAPINASLSMVFKLYTVPTGGSALYTETHTVSVTGGKFDVVIGSVTPLNLAFDIPYFLGVSAGTDPEMTPRQLVTASPYSLRSANADALAPAATIAGSQIVGSITTATIPVAQVIGALSDNGAVFMYNGVGADLDQLSPQGSVHNGGANVTQSQSPMPFACTAGSFYVWAPKGPTVISTYTLLKEGLPTAVTCTCNDLVNTAAFAAGEKVSTLVSGGPGAGTTVSVSWRCR
jgi:hypothetical protein